MTLRFLGRIKKNIADGALIFFGALIFAWHFSVLIPSGFAQAQEPQQLGYLEIVNLHIEPSFQFSEPKRGGFELGQSFFRMQWRRDQLMSGVLAVGNGSLLGIPNRYALDPKVNELAVIEAYAQLQSDYGRFRAGLIPIPFGGEGGDTESRRHLPRSLLFQNRWVNVRDYGLSYQIVFSGFFNDWAVHNGEGGVDVDNEAWFTARWGWSGWSFLRVGISGTTGRTNPSSTAYAPGETDPRQGEFGIDPGLDVAQPARIRLASAFFDWQTYPLTLSLETTMGDSHQGNREVKMKALRADLEYELNPSLSWLMRYDSLDPRDDFNGDILTEATVGFAWRSRYNTSVLYLLGTKRIQENVSPDTHRGMLIWRMTPIANGFRSLL